ncbi:MAG TPA: aminoacyl--tRNA ligase-related protein, partial [archaeon]|nr:aminoacyl--tRNA ligase-related protein [archaeon]
MVLKCIFNLSREAEAASKDMAAFIEEANKSIMVKGAPKEQVGKASRISDWRIKGAKLFLTIESGSYVRAPAAALRINKSLGLLLGEKYRIGVRGIDVTDFTVTMPITEKVSTFTIDKISKIEGVQSAKMEAGKITVSLKPFTDSEFKRNIPDRILSLIEKELVETGEPAEVIAEAVQVLKQGPMKEMKFKEDPMKLAVQLGWIKEFPARGQWIYTIPYTRLFSAIENIMVEEIADKLGFQPFMLPKLIPMEVMKLMPGYLDGIPEGMYYVCPPPREPEVFEKFKELVKITKEVPKKELKQLIKDPEYVLAPAQCEPFWYFFFKETLNVEELPVKFYDRSGWTYRWEGGGIEGLVRLQEFRRIELVYFGVPDDVVKIRDAVLDESIRTADKLLDLEWRVVPGIPFFMRAGGPIIDIRDSKNVAAYDLEIYLPYRGSREKSEWLEVTSCFVHKTKFIDAFKTRELKNRVVWSGCTGIGLSRWVAAFLSEHGFDADKWPKSVRERFGKYNIPKT